MRLSFFFIYLAFIVSAKRHNKYKSSDETSDESDEHVPFVDGFLDLSGGVRREFALTNSFVEKLNFARPARKLLWLWVAVDDHIGTSEAKLTAAIEEHGRNMICSPLSVLMPLGKLALGAEKRAERELLDAIGLTSSKQIKTSFAQLITNMEYLPGVNLDVASRVYVNTERDINKRFTKRAKLIFKSSCQKIRPSNPRKTAATINDWVAEKTRNKIRKLISPNDISRDTSLVLVNAIYFAGNWKYRFDKTFTEQFFSPSGPRRIPMMSRQGRYNYWKCDVLNAEVIEIPYEGSQASMIIMLPFSIDGLPSLLRALKLSPEQLNQALEKMKPADVILSMPKFKIETELNLNTLYKKIGLHNIFDNRHSDLTRIINDEKVYVSKSIHKAIIEVNEKGTEAAAATVLKGNAVTWSLAFIPHQYIPQFSP